ncbi:MAG: redoxin family protein [Acidobacteriia bacterium]|nr:redoxin family protein [Terriglobia bacterium]
MRPHWLPRLSLDPISSTGVWYNVADLAKKVETGANYAIILVSLVIAVVLVRSHLLQRPENPRQISAGTRFALRDVDWRGNERNVVFAISATCHFCTESAAFYRELSRLCKLHNVRTIAILPQPPEAAKEYTKSLGVEFDEVLQARLSELEIYGTPTLLFVDNQGVVRNVWIGKLPNRAEKEVTAKIAG